MPEPYYADDLVTLHLGDCRDVMAAMDAASVDAVACDPPYELGFMGRSWDASGIAYDVGVWRECLRVLKPGGHLLAFGGTRTHHRLACAIEDAGFEIRDSLHWVYGSGFPKSLDVSKAIDAKLVLGSARPEELRRMRMGGDYEAKGGTHRYSAMGASVLDENPGGRQELKTDEARQWEGWGTALKPSHEPIVVARKPLAGTVAGNVLEWGTGALNVDGCRVSMPVEPDPRGASRPRGSFPHSDDAWGNGRPGEVSVTHDAGRWPPNLLLTHSADCNGTCAPGCPVAGLDGQSGITRDGTHGRAPGGFDYSGQGATYGGLGKEGFDASGGYGGSGGASRFFPVLNWDPEYDLPFLYCAKAPKSERPQAEGVSAHPTVKPLAVMRWLVRLVTPPGGLVLDPFAGTGTTGQACALEGFRCVLAERDPDSAELARVRLAKPVQQQMMLDLPALPTTE